MSSRLLATTFVLAAATASAQTPAKPATPAPAQPASNPAAAAQAPAGAATRNDLEPRGYTYSGEGRRDPFISLLARGTEVEPTAPTARRPGLAGLGASEVTLRGTVAGGGGYVAILQGADNKTYVVRPGQRLLDGTVRAITPDALVILQQVDDPLAHEKLREVRKTLRQTEEA
jgi:Tfp pilus assembly protein PilP